MLGIGMVVYDHASRLNGAIGFRTARAEGHSSLTALLEVETGVAGTKENFLGLRRVSSANLWSIAVPDIAGLADREAGTLESVRSSLWWTRRSEIAPRVECGQACPGSVGELHRWTIDPTREPSANPEAG